MSAATEFPPLVHIPERARRTSRASGPRGTTALAVVPNVPAPSVLAPGASPAVGPAPLPAAVRPAAAWPRWSVAELPRSSTLRLTRRGYSVLAVGAALLAAAFLWLAHLSHPVAGPSPAAAAVVTVEAGDTLWSIAQEIAPARDPRLVVADLQRVNRLSGVDLSPGQHLRTR